MERRTKHIASTLAILILSILLLSSEALAQGRGRGKGGPPPWAPAHGYRAKQGNGCCNHHCDNRYQSRRIEYRHIYFPEENVYYDRRKEVFIHVNMGRWEVAARLPLPFENRLANSRQVPIDLDTDFPQRYNRRHIEAYAVTGRDSPRRTNY